MKDYNIKRPSTIPQHLQIEVNKQNSEILSIFSEHLNLIAFTDFNSGNQFDTIVSKGCGCSRQTVYLLRKRRLKYCGISLLTKICVFMELNFVELIRSPMPTERIKGEIGKKSIFGGLK